MDRRTSLKSLAALTALAAGCDPDGEGAQVADASPPDGGPPPGLEARTSALLPGGDELLTATHGRDNPIERNCNWFGFCTISPARYADLRAEGRRLVQVDVWHARLIDGLRLTWQTADGRLEVSRHVGGDGGRHDSFWLEPGEEIVRIMGRSGKHIDRLVFQTSRPRLHHFGGHGGDPWEEDLRGAGRAIHGISAQYNSYINEIAFYTYPR
jgi:hypothetical protein